jgi:hypothetical protein
MQRLSDFNDLESSQFGIDWQRKTLLREFLANREHPFRQSKACKGLLKMDWQRIMEAGLNAGFGQLAADTITLQNFNHVEVPGALGIRGFGRQSNGQSRQEIAISFCHPGASRVPGFQVP